MLSDAIARAYVVKSFQRVAFATQLDSYCDKPTGLLLACCELACCEILMELHLKSI